MGRSWIIMAGLHGTFFALTRYIEAESGTEQTIAYVNDGKPIGTGGENKAFTALGPERTSKERHPYLVLGIRCG